MTQVRNTWNEALRLRLALLALGIAEGEIAYPPPGAGCGATCFVSESISEAADLTPSLAQAVREAIQSFRAGLEGHSLRYEADAVDLLEGDSRAFLVAWGDLPERVA